MDVGASLGGMARTTTMSATMVTQDSWATTDRSDGGAEKALNRGVSSLGLEENASGGINVEAEDVHKMWKFMANVRHPMNNIDRMILEEAKQEELSFKHVASTLTRMFPDLDSREICWVLECDRHDMLRPDNLLRTMRVNECQDDVISEVFNMYADEQGNLDVGKVCEVLTSLHFPLHLYPQAEEKLTTRLLEESDDRFLDVKRIYEENRGDLSAIAGHFGISEDALRQNPPHTAAEFARRQLEGSYASRAFSSQEAGGRAAKKDARSDRREPKVITKEHFSRLCSVGRRPEKDK